MTPANLFDHSGKPTYLGQKLGKGGEGVVFEVSASSNLVAKIYHKPLAASDAAKLRLMIGLASDEVVRVAAWPTATLHERSGGPMVGFVMRRIRDYKEIHTLYSPAHRKTTFPQADWRFLVTTAMNFAAALENVHDCGVVVGDVNQSNVLVSAAGLTTFIDCDSFQISSNGQTYPCKVGVPLFTPPELQGQNSRGLSRTPNHDRFGLAVMIFHLLFMGRHPFSGRFLGNGEMPIERAISECRFAYGHSARSYQMQTPMHALPLSAVSPQLIDLFERAFSRDASRGNNRPTGADWHRALKGFLQSLRSCPSDQGHVYASHLTCCPWCNLMKQGAPNFFISVSFFRQGASRSGPVFVLATVWARIERVPEPNLTYQPPVVPQGGRPTPLPPGVPTIVPPKPVLPSILSSPPSPPSFTSAMPPKPALPSILSSPPSPPVFNIVVPPKPALPPILSSPPSPPALDMVVPPKPALPSILSSPPSPPVFNIVVPPKPALPSILSSPPSSPVSFIPTAASQPVSVLDSTLQRIVGIVSLVSGFLLVPSLFVTVHPHNVAQL